MAPKRLSPNPRRSLRTILIVWFLLFSIIPLAFVTGYSLVKYEQAIDNELAQRLRANFREVAAKISDYEKYLKMRMQRHEADTALVTHLSLNNIAQVRQLLRSSVRNSYLTSLSVFNRDGLMVASLTQDEKTDLKENRALEAQNLQLADNYRETLDEKGRLAIVLPGGDSSLDLVMMTRLKTQAGRRAGYLEEIINIGPVTLKNLKTRLNLEIILFDGVGNITASSHPDLLLYRRDSFARTIAGDREIFFDLGIRGEPFGFVLSPVKWGDFDFLVGLGASKQKSKAILKNINYAFFTVTGAIVILVIITAFVSSRVVLRPLNDLLLAIQRMKSAGDAEEIPVLIDNELGILTESFNEMSRTVRQTRAELENKIKELEHAYVELKDAQSKLVHSAKMVSLGQLVAGVAHELNNPIGFIYSNMSHLRDYSNRLLQIIEASEKTPDRVAKLKEESDFDYIVQDLPRLIQSCEDGARRVRDIVLGLRNFSRLEEAKIKRVDLTEGIQQTLRLLAGELKGRITVHTEFGALPEVVCYPSQLNQVFMNILSNAAQAIDGDGEIRVTTAHVPAGAGEAGNGHARITIGDSGKGMPADIVDKIFDPFFTTKMVGEGTGLGLSISYGIVKKHGGEINVKSDSGHGTEFTILLPIDGPAGADVQGDLSQH